MKTLAKLFDKLDQSNKTSDKLKALLECLHESDSEDLLWIIGLFTGRKPKKPVSSTLLRLWAAERSGVSEWMFEECYHVVGDLAETIAYLLPNKENSNAIDRLAPVLQDISQWSKWEEHERKQAILQYWDRLNQKECFLFNKFLTGGFRVGVSQQLLVQALARFTQKSQAEIQHRLMGDWHPMNTDLHTLLIQEDTATQHSKPYPFCLAHPLEQEASQLGSIEDWQAEWKWDGIRCQLIKRGGTIYLWSRGEELITERFPEIVEAAECLPEGIVLDGELVAWKEGQIQSFATLQTRITRKSISKKMLQENPAALLLYDVLEVEGIDQRNEPLTKRNAYLLSLKLNTEVLQIPQLPIYNSWEELARLRLLAREYHAEGLMLKHQQSLYHSGRKRGDWWKWKLDPYSIDAVLVYAQKGHGRRADLFTDYTFAVWDGDQLVTFTKAYSGLTDKEMVEVDRFVKKNTLEKFGPVRTVTPALVFEIGFEGIQKSSRHKSGVALRFPRILRWRKDKTIQEADTLSQLQKLLSPI